MSGFDIAAATMRGRRSCSAHALPIASVTAADNPLTPRPSTREYSLYTTCRAGLATGGLRELAWRGS